MILTVTVVILATADLGQTYPDGLAVGDRVVKAAGAWYPVLES